MCRSKEDKMDLEQRLAEGLLLLDGAMGTELMKLGMDSGQAGELWNREQPDKIASVHQMYLEAGSEAILTNTFGANRIKLAMLGLDDRAAELNKAGASVARQAAGDSALVFGDMGPTGSLPPSLGGEPASKMEDAFMEQAEALAEEGIDAFMIETMVSAEECEIAVTACEKVGGLPIIASMSFETKTDKGYRTVMGETAGSYRRLEDAGASFVGSNCGSLDAAEMADLVREIGDAVKLAIVAQPNAGKPVLSGGRVTYPYPPADMQAGVESLIKAGTVILGGCCGTTPDHIDMMRNIRLRN
jgi:5-methyltetrahydrofolate--homocysteine methyltransferase